jgi:nucleoside phosphorylase
MDKEKKPTYNLRVFRIMIVNVFSIEEIMLFAADVCNGDHETILNKLQVKDKIVYDLVVWCSRHDKLDRLLELVRERNIVVYQKYQEELEKPDSNDGIRVDFETFREAVVQSRVKDRVVEQTVSPILIVVVTKVEALTILKTFSAEPGLARTEIGKKIYYNLGLHGGVSVFMVQSEMGNATPSGGLLTVHQAIQDLHPQAVILCGIAYGLRPDQQKPGDILIAKQIAYYEPQKVDIKQGQIPRGDRTTTSERLLDRFRSADLDWNGAPTHFGLVLSGEKLVNDPAFRDRLIEAEPEAIGGEMEGAGLYIAARNAKTDWILVKAVCDWADGKKDDAAQALAANNAAQFVLHALQLGQWNNITSSSLSIADRPLEDVLQDNKVPYISEQLRHSYINFDLAIERAGDHYRAHVLQSFAGEGSVEFELPFSALELENFILKIGHARRGSWRSGRGSDSSEMAAAKKFGAKLFGAVFQGDVYTCLLASMQEARTNKQGVRVLLRLPPELTNLPWEYLYNPERNQFFSLSVDTPLVRYFEMTPSVHSLVVKLPLRLLVVISSPSDYSPLDVEREWRNLYVVLQPLVAQGLVEIDRLEDASLLALQRQLRHDEYHIFHFIGHGIFDERKQDGVLLFTDQQGRGHPLNGQDLGTVLRDHYSLRLAVLNACEGGRTGKDDPFLGVAHSLVQMGLPAVIAMQFEISDSAATQFSQEFYTALADGYGVDAALGDARKAIFASGNSAEWGTPVLFSRIMDGRIFDLKPALAAHEIPVNRPPGSDLSQVDNLSQDSAKKNAYRILRVFVSSSNDVKPEREVTQDVIKGINSELEVTNSIYRLEPFMWEEEDLSSAKNPQEVIFQKSKFESIDIFIGLFGGRFGTPTGRFRQSDSQPYLSGTEEELERVIEIYKQNNGLKPVIMLYKKVGLIPEDANPEQVSQVSEYFRRFKLSTDHPSFIMQFRETQEFKTILEGHLRLAIQRLSENWSAEQIQKEMMLDEPLHSKQKEQKSANGSAIRILPKISETQLRVGEPAHLNIEILANFTGEVPLVIDAEEFWIQEGKNIIAITLLDGKGNNSIEIIPRSAGEHSITIQAYYNHKRQSSKKLRVQVIADQKIKLELPDPLGQRSVPQPDLCIRVYQMPITEESFRLEYVLYSPHYSLHLPGIPSGSVIIKKTDIVRLMERLNHTLQMMGDSTNFLAETLASVGKALFDMLFSNQLKAIYQEVQSKIMSILILSDVSLWIPWELVKPYGLKWEHDFFASRYHIGRWQDGWGALRRAEFPIGQVCYVPGAGIAGIWPTGEWSEMFGEQDLPRLGRRLFEQWAGGYAAAMVYKTSAWGLHFDILSERLGLSSKEMIIVEENELAIDRIREYTLDLHTKRPLVTFGSLTTDPETTLNEVETRWLPTFIQSGASAFVSVLWSTSSDVDRLFWQTFYHAIWTKHSLGEAVHSARQVVKQTFPNSWDWLAYYLVGDPMSKGYIPEHGDGFISLECVNHDLTQPLVVGETYNFVASLRSFPPPWYQDRLYQSSLEEWVEPAVQVFAPEFTIRPESLLKLGEPVDGVRYAYFDIVPQKPEPVDMFIHFISDQKEVRHSLSFSMEVYPTGRAH